LRRPRDLELEAGATAHFEDAAYYDQSYASRRDDVDYYAALAARHGEVLEYGVGTGRIALPILRAGTRLVGIDRSASMLARLRAAVQREPADVRQRLSIRRGDMRRVRLGRRFSLVLCPFNTALHLYERRDVEAWLARAREHLTPAGTLVVDISMPILEDLADPPGTAYSTKPFVHPSLGRVRYREIFDYDRVRQILFVSLCFERSEGRDERMIPLAHRQFFPREWEALLHYNGFEAVAVHGDFEGGPLRQGSDVMIWHARPRRTR
jgi:ubiquinone/menaquinone biosynthesis C-methylase UbiE